MILTLPSCAKLEPSCIADIDCHCMALISKVAEVATRQAKLLGH